MSIIDIITVPDETLKKISEPIEKVGVNEKKLINEKENISKFCYGNSKYEIFKLIKTHNLHIEDTFNKKKVIKPIKISI